MSRTRSGNRRLLSYLSRCAWDSLEAVLGATDRRPDASPGAVIAIQTFGDFLNFNPHCHVLCTDGIYYGSGWFKQSPALDTAALEKIFQLISFIEDPGVVKKILKHLGLWEVKPRPPPGMAKTPPLFTEPHIQSIEHRA
ncbi:MAG: transposase [Thermodesulfobacteriota bacterium]